MINPQIAIKCDECGDDITITHADADNYGTITFNVVRCRKCTDDEVQAAIDAEETKHESVVDSLEASSEKAAESEYQRGFADGKEEGEAASEEAL
jgi:flagellar biosynthesis/type III secretory pathway protein FliH